MMHSPPRPLPFILAATEQGTLIVNRLDYRLLGEGRGYGVGFQLLNQAAFDPQEIGLVSKLLGLLRQVRGDGVVALDCGANVGVHTLSWARQMTGWGQVLAIEAQERIFYALAGNICLNNCFNARAVHAAVGDIVGTLAIPEPDYCQAASFGSLELKARPRTEYIGQAVNYAAEALVEVRQLTIDSLNLTRLDFIKLDVEGMEPEAIAGAATVLIQCRPLLLVEHIKTSITTLKQILGRFNYRCLQIGLNLLALHVEDPLNERIQMSPKQTS